MKRSIVILALSAILLLAACRLSNQSEQPPGQHSTEDVSVLNNYDDVKADNYYTLLIVDVYISLRTAAVTGNDFSYIRDLLDKDSDIYEREKKDVEDSYSKGIKQNLIMSYYIDIKELPDNKYYVYYIGEIEETDAANVVSEKTIAYVFTVFDDMEVQKILDISATIITPSDYSSFAGEWFCLERSTSLELEIDRFGYVKGNILPIAGQHVPCSPVSGFIEGNILTSRLYDGEYHEQDVGSLVLYFDNPEILKGTVTLIKPGLELAEGDMVFERYDPHKPNLYFFDASVSEMTYAVKTATENTNETSVVMHIAKIADMPLGSVYEFKLDDIAGFPADRLILGYFRRNRV